MLLTYGKHAGDDTRRGRGYDREDERKSDIADGASTAGINFIFFASRSGQGK